MSNYSKSDSNVRYMNNDDDNYHEDDNNDNASRNNVDKSSCKEPGLSIAVSYYRLFTKLNKHNDEHNDGNMLNKDIQGTSILSSPSSQQSKSIVEIPIHDDDISSDAKHKSNIIWSTDSWTLEEELEAERLIASNLERCLISTSRDRRQKHSNKFKHSSNTNSDDESLAWDYFYQQHQTNFFKDRHYLAVDFPHEFGNNNNNDRKCLIEVGCGVGNALLPLLRSNDNNDDGNTSKSDCRQHENNNANHHEEQKQSDVKKSNWTVYGLDFSETAISLLKQDARFLKAAAQGRAFAYVCDISKPDSLPPACFGVASVATLFFCLSAIPPQKHKIAIHNVASCLRQRRQQELDGDDNGNGEIVVFRDYGRYDQAQLKLSQQRHKMIQPGYYCKHDGTKCYYFTTTELEALFTEAGFVVLELDYMCRKCVNRATNEVRRRVWVQGRFKLCQTKT